ncbi:MAG: phosphoglycolate phosphatase [Methylococcaceae bacterium NSO1]|nr:MAG: phosphoglycolate phosphatase [Methylococcaceae bacterium NSO1]
MTVDFKLSCVLFDLDGTLVDTAPDLILCLNKALSSHGLTSVADDKIKPFISFGAVAMINESLNQSISEALRADILETMLDLYQNNIAEHTVFRSSRLYHQRRYHSKSKTPRGTYVGCLQKSGGKTAGMRLHRRCKSRYYSWKKCPYENACRPLRLS